LPPSPSPCDASLLLPARGQVDSAALSTTRTALRNAGLLCA
jgi:hypothetical protein